MTAPGTSVIVVSYKAHRWLEPSLASVADQAEQLIVVDNGSPGSVASATAARFGATVIRLPANRGFAGGVIAGLAAARGDVVALLNDDAMAGPDWLAAAARALDDDTVGAVTPKMVLPGCYAEVRLDDPVFHAPGDPRPLGRMIREATVDGRDVLPRLLGDLHGLESGTIDGRPARWRWTRGGDPIFVPVDEAAPAKPAVRINDEEVEVGPPVTLLNSAGTALTADGEVHDYGSERPDDGLFDRAEERFGACGGAMAMRADTLARVGSFGGEFFAYYEDADWCWRARLAGYRVLYDPAAVVTHVRWVTSGGPSGDNVWPLLSRNRVLTLVRNAPPGVAAAQLRRAWRANWPPGLRRALARSVPGTVVARRSLARRWRRRPEEVWREWAGRDQ